MIPAKRNHPGEGSGPALLRRAGKVGGADSPAGGARCGSEAANCTACRTRVRMGNSQSGRHTRTTTRQGQKCPCIVTIRSGNTPSATVIAKSEARKVAKRMESAACTSRTPEKTTFALGTAAGRTYRMPVPGVTSNQPEDVPPSAMTVAPINSALLQGSGRRVIWS